MTTLSTYIPSVLALIVGSSVVVDGLKFIVPGPETFDRRYHDIPASVSVPVILIIFPVLAILFVGIWSAGGVLSIL